LSGAFTINNALSLYASGAGTILSLGGQITGSSQITCDNDAGTGYVTFTADNHSSWNGPLVVNSGTFKANGNNCLGGGSSVRVNSGATFDLQNASPTIAGLNDNAGAGGTVVNTGSGAPVSTLTLGAASGSYSFAGTIAPATASKIALTKAGNSIQTLGGINTYSGPTTISAGTLALSGSGSINNSAQITVASGATFDVAGLSSTFTLGSSQTLSNSAVGAVINGANNTGSGTVSLVYDGVNPSFTVTNGTMILSESTIFKVNKSGGALAVGVYKPIGKATTGNVGVVAGTVSAVTVNNGAGVATLGIVNGELYLTNGGASNITQTGSSFTYNGAAQTPTVSFSGSTGAKTANYVGTSVSYNSVSAPTNAGTYYVSNTVAADANYFGATNSQVFTINPAPASVTADAKTKTYGDANPTLTATVAGTVNGDALNYTLATDATQFSSVGVSNIMVTLGGNPNYSVLATNSTLTINPASTFVGASSTKNPSGYKDTVSYTATLPVDATGSVVFSSTNGAFSTNTLSSGRATSLSTTNLPRGTNVITITYLGDGNYLGSTNTLNQTVTNHPPVAVDATYYRAKGISLKIAITNLLSNVTDVDGDTNILQSVGAGLTNATIMTDSTYVYYLPGTGAGSNNNDVISYTVSDGFGGTATANILVDVYSAAGPSQMGLPTNGVVNITFYGIPNYPAVVETTTNLSVPWWPLATNTFGTNGLMLFTDPNATNNQQYYRLSQP